MTIAFYAGSFDPLTNGHAHVIDECSRLFDKIIIGVGTNPDKASRYAFTHMERKAMIEEWICRDPSISVVTFERDYAIHVAQRHRCTHIVRGIRNAQDFEVEMGMAQVNNEIARSEIGSIPSTIFIPTPPDLSLVSSSMVKSLIGFGDWRKQIKRYLPETSYNALLKKYDHL